MVTLKQSRRLVGSEPKKPVPWPALVVLSCSDGAGSRHNKGREFSVGGWAVDRGGLLGVETGANQCRVGGFDGLLVEILAA